MVSAALFTLFVPIPGILVVGVALVVVIAEAHRVVTTRGGCPEAVADLVVRVKAHLPSWATGRRPSPIPLKGAAGPEPREFVMPVRCDVILQ
jgi:hypothetical protein